MYEKRWSKIFKKTKLKKLVNKISELDYDTLFKYLLLIGLLIYLILIKTC